MKINVCVVKYRVAFPEILNLNSFISSSASSPGEDGSEGFPEEVANSLGKCDDGSTTDSNSAIDDELSTPNDLNGEYEQVNWQIGLL